MDKPCYFESKAGFLRRLWQTFPRCKTCNQKGPVCPDCVGGMEDWDLSVFARELDFKVNDDIDVYITTAFGWIKGVVVGMDMTRFVYRVRLESTELPDPVVSIPFWPEMSDPYGIAPAGTYCKGDWRRDIGRYTYIECFVGGEWRQCKIVHRSSSNRDILVVEYTNDAVCHWFSTDSLLIRMLWEWS